MNNNGPSTDSCGTPLVALPHSDFFSLKSGGLSPPLETPLIQPVSKKGDCSNPSNYRPIALLFCFSKPCS